jgi:hypothetical protein
MFFNYLSRFLLISACALLDHAMLTNRITRL